MPREFKYLYIDTNVYLTFFHFSTDDLEALKKLIQVVKSGDLILFLPIQTKNEFDRNREVKIQDSFSRFKASKLNNEFPIICRSYPEYEDMVKAVKQYDQNKSKILEKLQYDAENMTLAADEVIKELFSHAKLIDTTKEILDSAVMRFNIGNPPGKDKSYGDAVNWESLLRRVDSKKNLYFISEDGDYYSKLNSKNFNAFLINEWEEKKESKLFHFKKLSDFLKECFPDIELVDEDEKELVINSFVRAGSFASAKSTARDLLKYDAFSHSQLTDIATAYLDNNQILNVADEYPLDEVRKKILQPNFKKIEENVRDAFEMIIGWGS